MTLTRSLHGLRHDLLGAQAEGFRSRLEGRVHELVGLVQASASASLDLQQVTLDVDAFQPFYDAHSVGSVIRQANLAIRTMNYWEGVAERAAHARAAPGADVKAMDAYGLTLDTALAVARAQAALSQGRAARAIVHLGIAPPTSHFWPLVDPRTFTSLAATVGWQQPGGVSVISSTYG